MIPGFGNVNVLLEYSFCKERTISISDDPLRTCIEINLLQMRRRLALRFDKIDYTVYCTAMENINIRELGLLLCAVYFQDVVEHGIRQLTILSSSKQFLST